MLQHAHFLKELFIITSSQSSYPQITALDVSGLAARSRIVEPNFGMQNIDRMFIAAIFQMPDQLKFSFVGNALVRFEFWEILVRIANLKYRETGVTQSFSEALSMLIEERLIPYAQSGFSWQQFRTRHLWTMEVNDLFEANLENLKKVYSKFQSPSKKHMTLEDAINLCQNKADLQLSEKDIVFCFGMSKMPIVSEATNYHKYLTLQFVEFLEFIGRLAEMKFRSVEEMANQRLCVRIEAVLGELLPAYGLPKHSAKVIEEDFSASDEDY